MRSDHVGTHRPSCRHSVLRAGALLCLMAVYGPNDGGVVYANDEKVTPQISEADSALPTTVASTLPSRTPQVPDQAAPPVGRDLRLSRFFNRLGRSFYRLGEPENVWAAVITTGSTGVAMLLDDEVHLAFPSDDAHHGTPTRRFSTGRVVRKLGDIGAVIGNSAVLGGTFGGLLLTGHLSGHAEMYSTGQSLLQGLIVTETVVQLTKLAVGRERPNLANFRSFPSGHTAAMVMTATIAGHRLGKKVGIPVTVLALGVAASRIEKHAHWLSDVAAGAGVGHIVGRTVLRSNGLFVRRTRPQRSTWTPVVHPRRLAMMVTW